MYTTNNTTRTHTHTQYTTQSIEIQSQTNGNQANTTNINRLARICFLILKQWQTTHSQRLTKGKENAKRRTRTETE